MRSRKPCREFIHDVRRKDVKFRQRQNLGPLREIEQAEGILSRRRAVAIVQSVGGIEAVPVRKRMVDANGGEVFPDRVGGIVERARGAGEQSVLEQFVPVRVRPQIEIRRDPRRNADIDPTGWRAGTWSGSDDIARQEPLPCLRIGHDRHAAQSELLPESFVVPEDKSLVLAERTAGGTAELVSLERWNRVTIKKVPGIEGAVAQEL